MGEGYLWDRMRKALGLGEGNELGNGLGVENVNARSGGVSGDRREEIARVGKEEIERGRRR